MEQQIRFCTTSDNVRIAYAMVGQGPPFVKAANWLTHLEFDWSSPIWHHWLESLAKHHTLLRYDERGCGLSDWDVEDFSFESWVHDLESVIDAVGLDHFPLLGISHGGPVAISYAVRYPEKVSHLFLYGTYARGRFRRNPSPEQLQETETLQKVIEIGWKLDNPAFRQVNTTLLMPEASAEQIRWFNDLQRISTSPENAIRFRKTFGSIDVSHLASQVAVPTLVLHARGDAAIPFEEGRHLATLIPDAQFVPLESNNHILLESEPAWQRFLDEVRGFLEIDVIHSKATTFPQVFSDLTERELELLELIAQGLNNTQIAEHLVISPKTVRNHITSIFSKLQVSDRAQAIVLARDAGLGQNN